MEDVLVPLFFFGSLFAFPLLRRQMIHRHRLEVLQQQATESRAGPDTAPAVSDAAELALRLPEPQRLYALALLCRLQDSVGEVLDARSAFVVRQARQEYLPATLRAYLNLTPAARSRLAAQGQNAEELLREQLELIGSGVNEALGLDHTAADHLLTQGHFLEGRFEKQEKQKMRVRA